MKIQRKTLVLGSISALALAALLAWAFAPRPLEVEVAAVTQGPFETTVDEDGQTRLRERYQVGAPLAGRLARITLREGDAVEAGATLATLTPALAPLLDERSTREAQARVATAQALLQRAATRIERAQVTLAQERNDLKRDEALAAQGFVAATKVDDDRLALRAAQSEADTAVVDREVSARELAQARAALEALRGGGRGSAFEVKSPVGGRVLKVHQTSEGTVAMGTPLVDVGDTRRLEVVADLLTSDALQIPPHAAVRIDRWGGPGELAGRVRLIEPAAVTKVSALGVEEQRVKVQIDLTSPPAQWAALGEAYRVGVRIVTRAVPQALQVPVSAVFPRPAGAAAAASTAASASTAGPAADSLPAAMAVYAVDGEQARLVPIELLARNGRSAWIRAELPPGRLVVIYPSASLRDGQRVRLRKV
ncbi:MAG TPA: HlyD family efflux transporter periplasmic adaptor subunit [Burkholderiaceae bacterium]|nr:HlyD family efflux transporter periplasmic adaptor subunit [Burkholderiaceae bacterium]